MARLNKNPLGSPTTLVLGLLLMTTALCLQMFTRPPATELNASFRHGVSLTVEKTFDWNLIAWPAWGVGILLTVAFGIVRLTRK